jgi:hypothetical protein
MLNAANSFSLAGTTPADHEHRADHKLQNRAEVSGTYPPPGECGRPQQRDGLGRTPAHRAESGNIEIASRTGDLGFVAGVCASLITASAG